MKVLLLVKLILWFADENLSACVWFHGANEVITYQDVYRTVDKQLEQIACPPLMEWAGEWGIMQQSPMTYKRLMRKKSNLTLAADSQMQVTFTNVEVDCQ